MSVKVRSPKTKRLIAIFSVLTVLTAGAGGFVIWQLTKDVGSDRSRADTPDTCGWCAGADQCWQSTGHAPEALSTPACGGGSCCTGFVPGGTTPLPDPGACDHDAGCDLHQCKVNTNNLCPGATDYYAHAYMSNAGFPETINKVRDYYSSSNNPNLVYRSQQPFNDLSTMEDAQFSGDPNNFVGAGAPDIYKEPFGAWNSNTKRWHETLRDGGENFWCTILQGDAMVNCGTRGCHNSYSIVWTGNEGERCWLACRLGEDVLNSCPDPGQWFPSDKIKCDATVTDRNSDGRIDYKDLDWDCTPAPTNLEEDPLCVSMKLNGVSRHDTALTVSADTQNIALALQGKDPDGRPLKMGYCYSIAGQTDEFYKRAEEVWICNDVSNFTDKGANVYEALWSNLTFAALRTALVNKGISGVTAAEINDKGLIFTSRIYDSSVVDRSCSTNPAYNDGNGVIFPGGTQTCDGDSCRGIVQLSETPICANISPKDVEIREARSITFTGTASSPVTVFKWRADTDCDGNVDEHEWITNTLTTASLTNNQAFNFTPGSSEVCRVEVRVNSETSTRPVCTFDIPYVPAGEIIVDKTGPVCVERVAPNNVARFTVTVTIPTDSEQDTMNIVRITDILPLGFRYVTGSATLTIGGTSQTLGVPTSTINNDVETLVWSSTVGWNLSRNQQMVLIFRATATGTARTGENINEVVVEPRDGDPVHDEYPFSVEQTCAPVPATGVMDILPYITTLCLLVLGIYLYREDFLLIIPKVHINTGVKEGGKLLALKLTRPKEYYEKNALEKLKTKGEKRKA